MRLAEKAHIGKTNLLCHFIIHATLCIIQIGVHGNDGYPILDSLHHRSLHIIKV